MVITTLIMGRSNLTQNILYAILFTLLLAAQLHHSMCQQQQPQTRYKRGILDKWFGSNAVPPVIHKVGVVDNVHRYHTINQQVPHYPIWKVHKYNGINLKPMPVSMVPQIPETIHKVALPLPEETFVVKANPSNVVAAPSPTIHEDIQGIMKLLGISDPTLVPSIPEIMEVLGAESPEEAIDTVKEIAATEEGVELIRSFISARQEPIAEEEVIEAIDVTEAPTLVIVDDQLPVAPKTSSSHSSWSPKGILSTASAAVASTLDRAHTNIHLAGKILPKQESSSVAAGFRGTLRNLRNFFTLQDNTLVPLKSLPESRPPPSVVYINEPIPATPINLPKLPSLVTLPELKGIKNIPSIPQIPHIQLPSHFSIPKQIVQGPYMKVKYPVSSYAPLPVFRQRPLYSYRGQQIGSGAPLNPAIKSSYDVPIYGPPNRSQIPYSQSTRDAFKNAPQIVSSLPVPKLPYTFDEEPTVDDQYVVAANSPIESITVSESAPDVESVPQSGEDDDITSTNAELVARGPQRLSGFEAYATGKVHRATNVEAVQNRLTNGRSIGDRVAASSLPEMVNGASNN